LQLLEFLIPYIWETFSKSVSLPELEHSADITYFPELDCIALRSGTSPYKKKKADFAESQKPSASKQVLLLCLSVVVDVLCVLYHKSI
jgi:hypothetical protein